MISYIINLPLRNEFLTLKVRAMIKGVAKLIFDRQTPFHIKKYPSENSAETVTYFKLLPYFLLLIIMAFSLLICCFANTFREPFIDCKNKLRVSTDMILSLITYHKNSFYTFTPEK